MTNLIDALHIPDTQSERDERQLAIQRVGVRGVRYPLQLRDRRRGRCRPSPSGSLDVALPAEQKGTHMSRFVAWLDALDEPLDAGDAARARRRACSTCCGADEGRVEARLPVLPAQARAGLGRREPARVPGPLDRRGARRRGTTVWAEVVVPVKSLCPCSKEISDYGAHNQRSHVTIRVELLGDDRLARAGPLRRGLGVERDLVVAQARRREVDHRARLREPEVRRGHGARRRACA